MLKIFLFKIKFFYAFIYKLCIRKDKQTSLLGCGKVIFGLRKQKFLSWPEARRQSPICNKQGIKRSQSSGQNANVEK